MHALTFYTLQTISKSRLELAPLRHQLTRLRIITEGTNYRHHLLRDYYNTSGSLVCIDTQDAKFVDTQKEKSETGIRSFQIQEDFGNNSRCLQSLHAKILSYRCDASANHDPCCCLRVWALVSGIRVRDVDTRL